MRTLNANTLLITAAVAAVALDVGAASGPQLRVAIEIHSDAAPVRVVAGPAADDVYRASLELPNHQILVVTTWFAPEPMGCS